MTMKMAMHRTLRHLLIALVLLFGQQAAQSHALSHLGQSLSCAEGAANGPCPAGHPAAQCLAFHAMDGALPSLASALDLHDAAPAAPAPVSLPLPFSPRIEFDSRAPPGLS
jgi:hypothetical protein